jgi:hypothetical protein
MNEREFEDIICKYPELIETGLKVKGRQVTVKGKRIDVLFEDRHGQDLIVEIQKGTVIRDHCSQLFDYEGYFVSPDNPNVRVMLVGNRVPQNLRRSLDHHGFEWKELTIKTLINFLSTKGDSALLQCLSSEEPLMLGINFPDQDKMIFEKHNLPLSLPEADNFRFVGSKRVDDFKTTFWKEFLSYLKRNNHEWVNGSKVMRGYSGNGVGSFILTNFKITPRFLQNVWEMRDVDQNLQISIDPSGPLHNRNREKRRMKTLKNVPHAH